MGQRNESVMLYQ